MMMSNLHRHIFSLSGLILGVVLLCLLVSPAFAQFNQQINYQGKLTDTTGSAVADGPYQMVFKLYATSTGGTAIWTETRSGANEVDVLSGLFSVMLGEIATLSGVDFNQTLYLGVTIEADAEMTPRKIIGAVPAAFESSNTQTFAGIATTSFLRSDQADTIAATTASTLLTVTQSGAGNILDLFDGGTNVFTVLDGGNVGIGTSTPDRKLTVDGTVNITGTSTLATTTITNLTLSQALAATSGGTGLSTITENQLLIGGAGNTWTQVATSSLGFSGSFTTSAELAAILSDETGTGYSVFNTSPAFAGTATFSALTATSTLTLSGTAANIALGSNYLSGDGDDEGIFVDGSGNVGIGTSTPSSKLTVVGDVYITGALKDSTDSAGTNGYVLQTTGTGTAWVATSTLGLGGGGASTFLELTDTPSSYTDTNVLYMGASTVTSSNNFTYNGTNLNVGESNGYAIGGNRILYASSTSGLVAIGVSAAPNVTGVRNIAIGYQALQTATSSTQNVAIGYQSLNKTTSGVSNVGIGYRALYNNTSGSSNFALGDQALLSNTSGDDNIAIGAQTLDSLTSGSSNTTIGSLALATVGTGSSNLSIGFESSLYASTANRNTLLGTQVARGVSGSSAFDDVVAVGYRAGYLLTTGTKNVLLGTYAGDSLAAGANNILVGYSAGDSLITGSNNIVIGYDIEAASSTGSNQLTLGNLIFGTGIDGTGTTLSSGNIGIGTSTPGSKLTVAGTSEFTSTLTLSGSAANIALGSNFLSGDGDDEGIYISSTGNVGIGLTTPTSKLQVAGTIATDYLTATGTPSGVGVSSGLLYLNAIQTSTSSAVVWTDKNAWNTSMAGSRPTVALADLDGDGDYDVMGGSSTGLLTAYENTGTPTSPTWTAKAAWDGPDVGNYSHPAFADLDGDGDYDMMVAEFSGTILGYENTGSASAPTWAAKTAWNLGSFGAGGNMKAALADLDNDGDIDILVGYAGGILAAYKNTGSASSPTWTREVGWDIDPPSTGHMPDFGDLDGDGDYDVLTGAVDGIAYGYENTGTASAPIWSAKSDWDMVDLGSDAGVSLVDLDNDGDLDVVNRNDAYENTGSGGSFSNTVFGIAQNGGDKLRINAVGALYSNNLASFTYTGASTALTATQSGTGDILNLFDGGTEVLTVLDGGNVGIGNTNPSAKLSVTGTLAITGTSTLATTTITNLTLSQALAATSGGTGLSTITENQLLIGGAGNTWTQVATSSLGLSSSFTTSAELAAILSDETGTGYSVFNTSPAFAGTATFSALTATSTLTLSGTAANIALGSNYLSGDGDDEGIFVDGSGNVGIGTSTPSGLLHVNGGDLYVGDTANNARNIRLTRSGSVVGGIGNGNNQLTLWGGSSATTHMSITSAGDVGIGTSTPGSKLTVVGDTYITGALKDSTDSAGTNGYVLQTTGTGTQWVATSTLGLGGGGLSATDIDTSAELAAILSDETGSGVLVFGTSPTFTTQITAPKLLGGTTTSSVLTLQSTSGVGTTDYISFLVGNNGATEALRILSDGSLQIGTNLTLTDQLMAWSGAATTTIVNNNPYAWTIATSSTGTPLLRIDTTSGSEQVIIGEAGGDVYIGAVGSASNLIFEESSTISGQGENTLTFGVSGDLINFAVPVGIGTTTPNNLLQVYDLISFNNTDFATNLGYQAGKNFVSGAQYTTFVGYQAGYASSTGSTNAADYNTAIGAQSLFSNTTGSYNTSNGAYSLWLNTSGNFNTANGFQSMLFNTSGSYNTAMGLNSLLLNSTGANNTALGYEALSTNTTGSANTALGFYAGSYAGSGTSTNTTSSNSLYLGYQSRAGTSGNTNEIVLGYDALGNGSNTATLGNDSIVSTILKGNVGIGTTTPTTLLHLMKSVTSYSNFITLNNTSGSDSRGAAILFESGSAPNIGQARIGSTRGENASSADIHIEVETGAGVLTEILTIDGSDFAIGIGTTTPSSLLTVAGTSLFTSTMTLSGSAANIALGSNYLSGDGGDEGIFVDADGNVGIGTSTPLARLEVLMSGTGVNLRLDKTTTNPRMAYATVGVDKWETYLQVTDSSFRIRDVTASKDRLTIDNAGNVGFGTTTPLRALTVVNATPYISLTDTVSGSSVLAIVEAYGDDGVRTGYVGDISSGNSHMGIVSAAGDISLTGTGGTCTLTGAASGGTCFSDQRLKTVTRDIENTLDKISNLTLKNFYWNDLAHSVNNASTTLIQTGFLAQQVAEHFPELVYTNEDGYKTLDYSTLNMYGLIATKELNLKLEDLATTTTFAALDSKSFTKKFFNQLINWFANTTNGIGSMYANVFNAKEKICVDGECLTADDIRALKAGGGGRATSVTNSGADNGGNNISPTPETVGVDESSDEGVVEESEVVPETTPESEILPEEVVGESDDETTDISTPTDDEDDLVEPATELEPTVSEPIS